MVKRGNRCKVCNCGNDDLIADINQMCISYIPFEDIAETAQARGLKISGQSIRRHARDHIEGYVPKSQLELSEGFQASDYEPTADMNLTPQTVRVLEGLNDVDKAMFAWRQQLDILIDRQERCIKGEIKEPHETVRSLKALTEVLSTIHRSKDLRKRTLLDLPEIVKKSDDSENGLSVWDQDYFA